MKKDKLITETVLTTSENPADNILLATTNSVLSEMTKAFPLASLITGSIEAYTKFRTLKEQKQLLAFIQEAENINQGFIERFFKDKSNTELGLEILGILDQTYLERQARMIGRVAIFFKNLDISKQEFDKYTYIITKLSSYLISLIEDLHASLDINSSEKIISIPLPNMDLISFEFIQKLPDGSWFEEAQNSSFYDYEVSDDFVYFYENIFKD